MKMLLAHKPELVLEDGEYCHNTVLHLAFGFRYGSQQLLSEELMLLVWQLSPGALLHRVNHFDETPFDRAVRSNNKFAMELARDKLSVDEIMSSFIQIKQDCPSSFFDNLRECLLEPLNKDVARTVCDYLGIGDGKRPNTKRMRGCL